MGHGRHLSVVLAAAFILSVWPAPAVLEAAPAGGPTALYDLPVPGGVSSLLAAARLPGSPDRSVALLALIRALHANPSLTRDAIKTRDAVVAFLNAPRDQATARAADDTVPLPLSPEVWTSVVFQGKVARDRLLEAILVDRQAALLYYGLMSLDEQTLALLAEDAPLLSAIARQAAPVLATCGRSIHVRVGAVVVPGGPQARPLWESIVGSSPDDPARFILGLLTRDTGRCAYFYDTLAHLDHGQQAFALGLSRLPGAVGRFRTLYADFVTFDAATWRPVDFPFARRLNDPAWVLMQVAATEQGEMAPPGDRTLWKTVFDGRAAECANLERAQPAPVEPAWLVNRLVREAREGRSAVLHAVAFAQRVFGQTPPPHLPAVCEALIAFPRYEGLLLTLETIGGFEAPDYVAAVRFASLLDPARHGVYIAQVQGALAILERALAARTLDRPTVRRLARSLLDPARLPAMGPQREFSFVEGRLVADKAAWIGPIMGQVGQWMRTKLFPALGCSIESADNCVAGAVSGRPVGDTPVVAWEGEQYRLDYGASARERLRLVRQRQRPNQLADVLAIFDAVDILQQPSITISGAERQAARLNELALRLTFEQPDRFNIGNPPVKDALARAAQVASRIAREDARAKGVALVNLIDLGDVLLADALTSFAYAMATSDPDSSVLLAGDPARRHDFGRTLVPGREPNGPWRVAEERRGPDGAWVIQGSLLGLNRVLAPFSVRRLSIEATGVSPTLEVREARAFAESALLLSPFDLTDASRDLLVAAIGRGRARVADVARDPEALAAAASAIGISEWRATAARWTARQPNGRVADLFSLAELLWLGEPGGGAATLDAWGVARRPLDGGWSLRLPRGHAWEDFAGRGSTGVLASQVADLHLRIGECLAEAGLPAALAAGVAFYAVWDFTTGVQMADRDDWLAVARGGQALSGDRLADYVSALTAPDGPLVPVGKQ
jgi:hypothetical protein